MKSPAPIMNNYVCVRHHRIKTLGEGASSSSGKGFGAIGRWRHAVRLQKTPNAHPHLTPLNLVAISKIDWKFLSFAEAKIQFGEIFKQDFLSQIATEKIRELGIKSIRSDATLIEEIHLSISPEYLRDGDESGELNQEKCAAQARGVMRFLKRRFDDNLLAVVVHNDESNPHACAFVLPAIKKEKRKRGRPLKGTAPQPPNTIGWTLSAKEMFSPTQCSWDQDRFAEACRAEGLTVKRGIEGSRTPHDKMRSHLSLVHAKTPVVNPIQLLLPAEGLQGLRETKNDYYLKVQADVEEQVKLANQQLELFAAKARERDREVTLRKGYQATASEKGQQLAHAKETINQLQVELEKMKAQQKQQAELMRDIPMDMVAARLGLTSVDKGRWRGERGIIRLHEKGFVNEKTGAKGRNSIDLVEHVLETKFQTAVRWLFTHFGLDAKAAANIYAIDLTETSMELVKKQGSMTLRESLNLCYKPNENNWQKAKAQLTEATGVPEVELDQWHAQGIIGATNQENLIFELRDLEQQNPTGYLCASVQKPSEIIQTVGNAEGVFIIQREVKQVQQKLVIVSDPVEAMAFASLHPETQQVIAPTHLEALQGITQKQIETRKQTSLAFSGDRARSLVENVKELARKILGQFQGAAESVIELLIEVTPPLCGSWLSDLKAFKTPAIYSSAKRAHSAQKSPQILIR